jgi:hypothetical protein
MKLTRLFAYAALPLLLSCNAAVEFNTFVEADDPVAVSEKSLLAWNQVGRLNGIWASADSLYSRSEVPVTAAGDICRLEGWKGERVSAQFLLYTGEGADCVVCKVSEFTSDDARMSSDIATASFVRYTLADQASPTCRCDRSPYSPAILVPDLIDTLKVFNMESKTTRPVWVTVNIPQDAKPGVYKSEITVSAKGCGKLKMPLEVEVIDQVLPTYEDWKFHLDLWQHPSAVARMLKLDMWSDEHFEALKEQMRPLAEAGQKVITATLNRDPWGYQTYDDYEEMIFWIRHKDGSWSYDYTVFDRWVELMMELGVKKQINCYSMIPWSYRLQYLDEESGIRKHAWDAIPGTEEFEFMWAPFLQDFVKHLKEKGWLEITNIATDERSPEEMDATVAIMQKYAPELGFAMADNHASYRRYPNIRDCSVAQRQLYLTDEELQQRKTKGHVTTFYVCCSTFFPNTFSYSQPFEAELLNWHAIVKDYDGQLRWSVNSWPDNPEYDSRFRLWGSGDTYSLYPYGRTSMRFERMRDGVEAYEKVRILREKYSDNPEGLKPLEDALDKLGSYKLTDNTHPWTDILFEANAALNQVSKDLAE